MVAGNIKNWVINSAIYQAMIYLNMPLWYAELNQY